MSQVWMSKQEAEIWKEWHDRFWSGILWGISTRQVQPDDNVKLAWVIIEGNRTMIGVDNKTLNGYALRDDVPEWKLPLEPVKYDSFERWYTTFDV